MHFQHQRQQSQQLQQTQLPLLPRGDNRVGRWPENFITAHAAFSNTHTHTSNSDSSVSYLESPTGITAVAVTAAPAPLLCHPQPPSPLPTGTVATTTANPHSHNCHTHPTLWSAPAAPPLRIASTTMPAADESERSEYGESVTQLNITAATLASPMRQPSLAAHRLRSSGAPREYPLLSDAGEEMVSVTATAAVYSASSACLLESNSGRHSHHCRDVDMDGSAARMAVLMPVHAADDEPEMNVRAPPAMDANMVGRFVTAEHVACCQILSTAGVSQSNISPPSSHLPLPSYCFHHYPDVHNEQNVVTPRAECAAGESSRLALSESNHTHISGTICSNSNSNANSHQTTNTDINAARRRMLPSAEAEKTQLNWHNFQPIAARMDGVLIEAEEEGVQGVGMLDDRDTEDGGAIPPGSAFLQLSLCSDWEGSQGAPPTPMADGIYSGHYGTGSGTGAASNATISHEDAAAAPAVNANTANTAAAAMAFAYPLPDKTSSSHSSLNLDSNRPTPRGQRGRGERSSAIHPLNKSTCAYAMTTTMTMEASVSSMTPGGAVGTSQQLPAAWRSAGLTLDNSLTTTNATTPRNFNTAAATPVSVALSASASSPGLVFPPPHTSSNEFRLTRTSRGGGADGTETMRDANTTTIASTTEGTPRGFPRPPLSPKGRSHRRIQTANLNVSMSAVTAGYARLECAVQQGFGDRLGYQATEASHSQPLRLKSAAMMAAMAQMILE